ncbi:MAG: hypothetical protein AAFQ14_17120 [Cyanobacteria bacterium J06621_12]
MPNKRSKRRKTKKYFCPHCEQRLWRLGNSKHHLYYQDAEEIRNNTGIPLKKAKLLSLQSSTYLDQSKWIESFCCPSHGMMWLLVSVKDESYEYRLARGNDWLRTNKTIDPRIGNPSVSEFTLRMSRKPR